MSKTIKNPSPLVEAVLSLDEHFTELGYLSARINELDLDSESDLKKGERLLVSFTESGQAVSTAIQTFVALLNDSRQQAEQAAASVSQKAEQLRAKKDDVGAKLARFQDLNERVSQLNEELLSFKRPEGEALTAQDQVTLKAKLTEVAGRLDDYIEEARQFQEIGHQSNIKFLQQNADSMKQSLIAVSKKIREMVTLQ